MVDEVVVNLARGGEIGGSFLYSFTTAQRRQRDHVKAGINVSPLVQKYMKIN
jgi:hypothetical protein